MQIFYFTLIIKLQERDQHMLVMLQNISSLIESSSSSSSGSSQDFDSPPSQAASSITNNQTQLAILQLLKEIQLNMKKLPLCNNSRSNGNGINKQCCQNKKTPDNKNSPSRANTSHYCWTHGA